MTSLVANGQDTHTIFLKSNDMESNGMNPSEEYFDKEGSAFNVAKAELYIYLSDSKISNGQMVLVCGGGGYSFVAVNNEGIMVAKELNKIGVSVAVLKYRHPNGHHSIPLKDALSAMDTLRSLSKEYGINKIGIMGFSAGGHLASTALTHYTTASNRPDFGILGTIHNFV